MCTYFEYLKKLSRKNGANTNSNLFKNTFFSKVNVAGPDDT